MPQFETSTYLAQIVWLLMCFFSLWFALSCFIVPKIEDILKQRRNKIDGYIQKAEQANRQALSSLEKYEEALKQATSKANVAIAENEKALREELTVKRREQYEILARNISENEKTLVAQRQETLHEIDTLSDGLALEILRKIGFKNVTSADLHPHTDKE